MKETQLAWLAGLIDGEGSIILSQQRDGTMNTYLVITNTNVDILNNAEKIYQEFGINPHWYEKKNYRSHHNKSFNLQITRLKQINLVLKAILPYLIGKRAQAETFIRYADRRLKLLGMENSDKPTVGKDTAKYDAFCRLESDTMKSLNQRSKSSQAIRQMPL